MHDYVDSSWNAAASGDVTPPLSDRWRVSSWSRIIGEPERLPRSQREALAGEIAGLPDDATVRINAGFLRALLRAHEPPQREVGAAFHDQQLGVTYRATIGRGAGRVWITSAEVVPDGDRLPEAAWRVPHGALAGATARHLAEVERVAGPDGDPSEVEVIDLRPASEVTGVPDAAELSELLAAGETRQTIAERFGRSISRVDDWLRTARRAHPELDWPPQRRGPKPRTEQRKDQE